MRDGTPESQAVREDFAAALEGIFKLTAAEFESLTEVDVGVQVGAGRVWKSGTVVVVLNRRMNHLYISEVIKAVPGIEQNNGGGCSSNPCEAV